MAIKKREALTQGDAGADNTVNKPKNTASNEKGSFMKEMQKHMMTGISNMIPFLIMGGLILAFSQLVLYVFYAIAD